MSEKRTRARMAVASKSKKEAAPYYLDPEINALATILRALQPLSMSERWRLIEYARRRYETSEVSEVKLDPKGGPNG